MRTAEESITQRLQQGAGVEPGDHTATLHTAFRRNAWREHDEEPLVLVSQPIGVVWSGCSANSVVACPVRADAITTFDVSGTAINVSGLKLGSCASGATCAFSGMFQVDTTTGTVERSGLDITLPGVPALDSLFFGLSPQNFNDWEIGFSGPGDQLLFDFTTAPTPGSLKGFTGGSIIPDPAAPFDAAGNYEILGGSITPVPEPSSLVLFASGMLVLGLTRRFGKKVGHQLSA